MCRVCPLMSRKGGGAAKMAGIELACRLSGLSQREIGEHCGGMSSQSDSVSQHEGEISYENYD